MLLLIVDIVILFLFSLPFILSLFRVNRFDKNTGKGSSIQRNGIVFLSGILVVLLVNFMVNFTTEYYWFDSLGFKNRFWVVFLTRIILFISGSILVFLFLYLNFLIIRSRQGLRGYGYVIYIIIGISLLFGFLPAGLWNEILLYVNQVKSTLEEPILGRSISYYIFSLPLYSSFVWWLTAAILASLVILISFSAKGDTEKVDVNQIISKNSSNIGHFLFLISLLCMVIAWYYYLQIYYLLYGNSTAVTGAGYTDTHVNLYANAIVAGVFIITAIMLIIGTFSKSFRNRVLFISEKSINKKILFYPGIIIAIMIISLWLVPLLVQSLIVSPNEITLEKPYLQNNINFTRKGFSIDDERISEEFYPIGRNITNEVIDNNESTLMNVRLWDWRALLQNLRQQQEIRLYYQFNDVDIDRYNLDGKYRQVMLAARELAQDNLDPRSRNWVSLHLKYTHGFGAVLLPAHDILPQGKPDLLIRGIPPESSVESISITEPRIYYGELTDDYIYVKTTELEFDYPIREQIIYNTYDGEGGISIGPFLNKLLYALRFDDYRLLISGYFTQESKILFRRAIKERVQAIMPFLLFDQDPYPVITEQGRIVWILDAYTTSSMFPYSQTYRGLLEQFYDNNYIRNSVKIVIDAYHGTVEPYIVDSSDVIISTYKKIFPGLFKNFNQMPDYIKEHIRYPLDYFTIQTEMYSAYHMVNPETYYQREDLWEYATERYREEFQLVSPYYAMLEFPDQKSAEFALIVPFTPKNKNVMNAWMAGRSDIPNYGNLTVYPFPKGVEVFGPRQIEARIDQNTIMSQSITLWGQRGSEVVRGNLLVIPLFHKDSLFVIYVEPVIIQAEDAQLPEIKRIIVSDQNQVLWAENFNDALELLVEEVEPLEQLPQQQPPVEAEMQEIKDLLLEFRNLIGQGEYSVAGEILEKIMSLLENQNQM